MLASPISRSARRFTILLAQIDNRLAERLGEPLRTEGYRVSLSPQIEKVESCLERLRSENPDILILAAMSGGLTLCRQLRQLGCSLPVLLLSDGGAISERAAGLEVGADDYMVPPYSPEELVERVQCLLRRFHDRGGGLLRLADLVLNTRTREVRRASRAIELTAREYDLLLFLLERADEVLGREQILQGVWGEHFDGESNVVEVYVRYLRMKIERPGEKKLIHTVRGVGYSLHD